MNKKNLYPSRWRFAAKVFGCHLGISALIALLTAWLVFKVWYPYPYNILVGGLHLYALVMVVDVVCGPLLTFILANPRKSKREMALDFSLVGFIQLAALAYGLYAVSMARPVVVAFEVDRFTVVSAAEIDAEVLPKAPQNLQQLSWSGPRRLGIREPKNVDEKMNSLEMSLQGVEPSARPDWWLEDGAEVRAQIRTKMQPLAQLQQHYPDNADLQAALKQADLPVDKLYYLPFTSQKNKDWVVLLDEQTQFRAFAHVDGFIEH